MNCILSLILPLISIVISVFGYFLAKKEFKHQSKKDIYLINIDLLKIFYQNIILSYEKLKLILQTEKNSQFLNLQSFNLPFFEINNEYIDPTDEKLKDNIDHYLEYLSGREIKNEYLKLSENILVELQIFAFSLNLQSDTIKFDSIEKIIAKKYITIFERIFPCLMSKNDIETYQECINLYTRLKKPLHY